jgi:Protein of unknown function (DUF3592)
MPGGRTTHRGRATLWTRLTHSTWIQGGGFCCLLGTAFVLFGAWPIVRQARLDAGGLTTHGVIDTLRVESADASSTEQTRHLVSYSFTTADGRHAQVTRNIETDFWESLHPGDAVRVTYLPGTPESSRLVGEPRVGMIAFVVAGLGVSLVVVGVVLGRIGVRRVVQPAAAHAPPPASPSLPTRLLESLPVYVVVGGLLGSIGLTFLAVGGGAFVQAERFRLDGRRAQGVVVSKGVTTSLAFRLHSPASIKTRTPWARYRFETPAGNRIDATDDAVTVSVWNALTEGGPVTVEYLSHDPSVNWIAGDGGVRWPAYLIAGLGLLFTGVATAVVVRGSRHARRHRRRTAPAPVP